jgi:Beta-lactamase enzyme family
VLVGCLVLVLVVGALVARGLSSPSTRTTSTTVRTDASEAPTSSTGATGTLGIGAGTRPARDPLAGPVPTFVSGRQGSVLAAVEDLKTRQIWTLGSSSPQHEASIVKVDILEALLAHRWVRGHGLPTGLRTLAKSMITDSDNDAATDLWQVVGSAKGLRAFNKRLPLRHTTPWPCVVCSDFPWPGWGLTTTTPRDQLTLLRTLVEPNAVLSTPERRYGFGLMEGVTASQRWGITGGVPTGVSVALKNGWLPLDSDDTDWQINSIGWVQGLGRDYLIAVMTTRNPSESYGISTIEGVSSLVWRRLAP